MQRGAVYLPRRRPCSPTASRGSVLAAIGRRQPPTTELRTLASALFTPKCCLRHRGTQTKKALCVHTELFRQRMGALASSTSLVRRGRHSCSTAYMEVSTYEQRMGIGAWTKTPARIAIASVSSQAASTGHRQVQGISTNPRRSSQLLPRNARPSTRRMDFIDENRRSSTSS